jgi:hypothetical protein
MKIKDIIEKETTDRILYIGGEIPNVIAIDKRPKFILLGTPREFIDEIIKRFSQETL